jgi:hypothetical protein
VTVETPDTNSYSRRNEIIWEIDAVLDKDDSSSLLLLACWPLSKILAYEYAFQWVQSIDIGRGIELISFRSDGDLEFLL